MIPIWAPFAALTVVCAFCPPPRWIRSVDWVRVGSWALALGVCLLFWFDVVRVAVWVAS